MSLGLSGAHNGILNMSGGTISGNTLTEPTGTGKGVAFFTERTAHDITYYTIMRMSGSAKVDTSNDVYLNEHRMITVDGVLTGAAPVACLTPASYSTGRQVLDGRALGAEHGKFAVTPQAVGSEIKNNCAPNGGGVPLGLSGAHNATLNMSGGTISGNTLTNPVGTGKGVALWKSQ